MIENEQGQSQIIAIVLAAGQGKRMNSSLPKVAHLLLNKPLITWVIESLETAGIRTIVPVIAPSQTIVRDIIQKYKSPNNSDFYFAYQDTPQGTGHAVKCGLVAVKEAMSNDINNGLLKRIVTKNSVRILVSYGDTPAVKPDTFKKLISHHEQNKNIFTILAFRSFNPFGYGRIITNSTGEFIGIREQKDCTEEEAKIQICNSGFLFANYEELEKILPLIKNDNAAKEYYLTDIPQFARECGFKVGLMVEQEESQFLGINTQEQLKEMEISMSSDIV